MPETTVVHWNDRQRERPYHTILIDRTTPFGNPFVIGKDGDRAEVLAKFEAYFEQRLQDDPAFWYAVQRLIGHELACHCKPMDCHGDIIAAYLRRRYGG